MSIRNFVFSVISANSASHKDFQSHTWTGEEQGKRFWDQKVKLDAEFSPFVFERQQLACYVIYSRSIWFVGRRWREQYTYTFWRQEIKMQALLFVSEHKIFTFHMSKGNGRWRGYTCTFWGQGANVTVSQLIFGQRKHFFILTCGHDDKRMMPTNMKIWICNHYLFMSKV